MAIKKVSLAYPDASYIIDQFAIDRLETMTGGWGWQVLDDGGVQTLIYFTDNNTSGRYLHVFGWYISLEDCAVYGNVLSGDEMYLLFNFESFIYTTFGTRVHREVLIASLQKYKLTGNLEDFYNIVKASLGGLKGEASLISNYITVNDQRSGSVPLPSYTLFAGTLVNLFTRCRLFFKNLSSAVRTMEAEGKTVVDPRSRVSFPEFSKTVDSMAYDKVIPSSQEFVEGREVDTNNPKSIEKYFYRLSAISQYPSGMTPSIGELRACNLMELLDTLKQGNEVIYSANLNKVFEEIGISKVLSKKELTVLKKTLPNMKGMLDGSDSGFAGMTFNTPTLVSLQDNFDHIKNANFTTKVKSHTISRLNVSYDIQFTTYNKVANEIRRVIEEWS